MIRYDVLMRPSEWPVAWHQDAKLSLQRSVYFPTNGLTGQPELREHLELQLICCMASVVFDYILFQDHSFNMGAPGGHLTSMRGTRRHKPPDFPKSAGPYFVQSGRSWKHWMIRQDQLKRTFSISESLQCGLCMPPLPVVMSSVVVYCILF